MRSRDGRALADEPSSKDGQAMHALTGQLPRAARQARSGDRSSFARGGELASPAEPACSSGSGSDDGGFRLLTESAAAVGVDWQLSSHVSAFHAHADSAHPFAGDDQGRAGSNAYFEALGLTTISASPVAVASGALSDNESIGLSERGVLDGMRCVGWKGGKWSSGPISRHAFMCRRFSRAPLWLLCSALQ